MDTQTHKHISIEIDLRDNFQAGTDSDLRNRLQTGDDERHREMSKSSSLDLLIVNVLQGAVLHFCFP